MRQMYRTNFDALATKLAIGVGLLSLATAATLILTVALGEVLRWWLMP